MATSLTSTGVRFPDNSVQIAPALTGFRNRIINGDMRISQRGTSFSNISNAYCIDRFIYNNGGAAVVNITQSTDVPANSGLSYSLRATVGTVDTSIAAGDHSIISQIIEGYNLADLVGVPFTISFWVRSSKTGIHCWRLTNSGRDRSIVVEYTINSANTWEKKSIVITGGLITDGTWDFTNGIGAYISWVLAAGSTYQTATTNSWITTNSLGTANQVNCLDTVGNVFAITGVQVEKGSTATDFEFRPYPVELSMCQRYFQKLTSYIEVTGSTGYTYNNWFFKVSLRTSPTVSNTGNGANGNIYNANPLYVGLYTSSGGNATWGATSTASAEL